MGQELIVRLNGQIANPAINVNEVEIEVNHDPDDPTALAAVKTNNWQWSVLEAGVINKHLTDGWLFEGLPFTMDLKNDTGISRILDGYLDLTEPSTSFKDDFVSAGSKLRGGNDWLTDNAGFPYSLLIDNGILTDADKVKVPYIISTIPDTKAVAIMVLTSFVIINEILRTIKDLKNVVVELGTVITAIAGILKLLFLILYIIALLISLIKLILDIKNALIQPVKYQVGMRLQRLLEAGAEHLEMDFQSSIFDDDKFYRDTIILPARFETEDNSTGNPLFDFVKGLLDPSDDEIDGHYSGTYGDLLRICKDIFNAKLIVANGIIRMERVDHDTAEANYTLPAVELETFTTNADEFAAYRSISFATDSTDNNTFNEYVGTKVEITTEPKTFNNRDMVIMKGEDIVEIPFARGVRKGRLTKVEEKIDNLFQSEAAGPFLGEFFKKIDEAIDLRNAMINKVQKFIKKMKVIGVPIPFETSAIPPVGGFDPLLFEDRIGMLLLENDYFGTTKIMSLDIAGNPHSTDLKEDNADRWSALELQNEFHYIKSWVVSPKLPNPDQYKKYEVVVASVGREDFVEVQNNNLIFTNDGQAAKADRFRLNVEAEEAIINLRIKTLLTTNLKETINIPDAEA